jgi:hypothetical protein
MKLVFSLVAVSRTLSKKKDGKALGAVTADKNGYNAASQIAMHQ